MHANETIDFIPVFKNTVKFNHDEKLPRLFRCAVIGKSGSGKSVLVSQLLLQPNFLDYNKLFIYSKMFTAQPEMKIIKEAFNKSLSKESIINLFKQEVRFEEFPLYIEEVSKRLPQEQEVEVFSASTINEMISELDLNPKNKNLVIFDDFLNDTLVNDLAESYFNNSRKQNANLFYIAQRYSSIPKMIRSNLNFVISFIQSKRDSDLFYNDILSPFMDKKDFKKLIDRVWAKDFRYIAVNVNTGKTYTNLFH